MNANRSIVCYQDDRKIEVRDLVAGFSVKLGTVLGTRQHNLTTEKTLPEYSRHIELAWL